VKTTLGEREGNTVKFTVEVSSEEVQEAFDTHLKQLAKEVRIPGFRKGKVPLALVRQRLGEQAVLVDAIEEAVGGWFATAALQLELDPVDRPHIELLGEEPPALGKPLGFTASVTVMPEVVLGQYKGIEVPREPVEVADEEVDAQFNRLREEFAELKPVDDRPVAEGDYVTADFRATHEGRPVEGLEASDYVFEVGGGRIFAEVEQQVVGMAAGEERTFAVSLPEDFPLEQVAGKEVDFTITVKEIKEKELPPLTDQWASEISEFGTLLELRNEIRNRIKAGKTYAAEQRFRSLAVQAAADNAVLDLPDVIVREQAEEMVNDFRQSLEARGGSFEAYLEATGTTREQMIEDLKPQAARNVKTGLVLDAVAKAEGLVASDEEVKALVAQTAAAGRVDADRFEEQLRKTGRIETFRWQILRDKAADFIAANAVATTAGEAAVAEAKAALAAIDREAASGDQQQAAAVGEEQAAPAVGEEQAADSEEQAAPAGVGEGRVEEEA
jgi:trigger factor